MCGHWVEEEEKQWQSHITQCTQRLHHHCRYMCACPVQYVLDECARLLNSVIIGMSKANSEGSS